MAIKGYASFTLVIMTCLCLAGCVDDSAFKPLKDFGLVDTWAEDCGKQGSLHMTFANGADGRPTITMASQNDRDGNGTLYFEIVSASKITEDKLRVITVIVGKDDMKLPREKIKEQKPEAGVFEAVGKKMKMDGGRLMEKCLK